MIHKNDLKQIIKEEYHKVKNYMESEYGFTPELGKVMSNPYVNAFESVNEVSNDYSPMAYAKLVANGKISMEKAMKETGYPFTVLSKLVKKFNRNYKFESNESSIEEAIPVGFEIGDFIHFKKANKTGMVKKINGDKITIMTMRGDFTGDIKDVQVLYQDNVNEGGESDADMAVDQLQSSIEHAQELLDKLRSRSNLEPWVQSLITKAEDYLNIVNNNDGGEENIEEYDVESAQDIKEFVQFMENYKPSLNEAEYQGRKVKLGKIMQGDVKKFKVYVKNDKGNVVKVNFGQGGDAKGGTMRIRKDNPEARKSFRARHNCDNPGPRWKARYWSCRKW